MSEVLSLNGYSLYHSFLSGYEQIASEKNSINDINVFPVADGDTGNNMVSTLQTSMRIRKVSRSVSLTINEIADQALSGARGNSGIILAQYINGLATACEKKETLTTAEFGAAVRHASELTWQAIENPREGTLLTLLRVWSAEIHELSGRIHDFRELFLKGMEKARAALEETTGQLEVLRKANVVDAGARGFVSFLEGVARMIHSGKVPRIQLDDIVFSDDDSNAHDIPEGDEDIPHRFCTEALIAHRDFDIEKLRAKLAPLGDSLIISRGRIRTKIHIHTNEPAHLFFALRDIGTIVEQKVDDMKLQYQAVHHPLSTVAIVTDSIADIPRSLLDRYQIHVINQKILWGEDEYLDRLTITGETFYPYLDQRKEYPSSSTPDPKRVAQAFAYLAAHYRSIIAIPVSRGMSATWQVMEGEAEKLRAKGYPITVLDSRLNSAAQGLVVIQAAKNAAEGRSAEEIRDAAADMVKRTSIYVSVSTFKYMVRGGRISKMKGLIGKITNMKPIITIDVDGKGVAYGASFSAKGSRNKIMNQLAKQKDNIECYAVVHAAALDTAMRYIEDLKQVTGKEPDYVMEISPVVGIHAGIGAVAVACTLKK